MKKRIEKLLAEIEADEHVHVVYACESGSRAWGFPSVDSDYDVRFIYIRPRDWYLSIEVEKRRDVIERPLTDNIDLSGWDLRKALVLLKKSNPPLLEWLVSPIVYRDLHSVAEEMRILAAAQYSPRACAYHYLRMAQNTVRAYFQKPEIPRKKYFYALRPLLAVEWLKRETGLVPMEFETLVHRLIDSPELTTEIGNLLAEKKAGKEMGGAPRNAILCDYIEGTLARQDAEVGVLDTSNAGYDALNSFFRKKLAEIYSQGAV